ncbi:nose resistant to fluoxetine protein 6 isoform X2 [Ixodes scapularis]|uniref:nose resistant to fluoxetine protein 6 isoform X2 n=1 Tax=Ixodes scapularis TaxID=6945 RepID=UPI001AD7745C|nr:nose resistant to fluoxetine protein 6 isoform X2 [Ixodes scapularis]
MPSELSLLKSMLGNVIPVVQRSFSQPNVSRPCTGGLLALSRGLLKMDIAAWRFLDATGKFPSGLLEGSTADLGAYDECLASRIEISEFNSDSFSGQYCSVFFRPQRSKVLDRLILQLTRYPVVRKRFNLTTVHKALKKGRIHGLRFGLCVPSVCKKAEVELVLGSLTQMMGVTSFVAGCRSDEPEQLNAVQIAFVAVFGVLLFLLTAGTLVDTFSRMHNKPASDDKRRSAGRWTECMTAFSAISNTESLLKATSPELVCFKCLNGLRFFSAVWVILGHSYSVLDPHILGRGLGIFEMTHEILFCIISNAYPSVETFFVISGFLLVHNLLPKLKEQRRKLTVLLIVEVRRYIRITTPMMFLLGLIFLFPLLVHGPAADEWLPVKIEKCYRNWWAIPLHFNNWLTHKDICAGHLWYLACDMQIFTVVALLCVLLAKNVRVGIAAMVAIAASCNIFIAYFTHSAQIGPSRVSSGGDVTKMMQALDLIHQRPYPHVASYVTGALVGFVFLKYRHVRLRQVTRLGLWLCSTVFCLYGVFGAFKWQKGAPPTGVDVALFNGVHRTAFAMGVAWVLYACASGQAKIIDRFLAWDGFVLLGRLTFSVYLVHFLVLVTSAAMARERIYMAHWFLVPGVALLVTAGRGGRPGSV